MKNPNILLYGFPLISFLLLAGLMFVTLRHIRLHEDVKFAQHLGEAAPPTDLPLLDNPELAFHSQEWKGHPYVLNFFASWCVDCRAEHNSLHTLADLSIPVIGIAFKDSPQDLHSFFDREGNPYVSVAMDNKGRTGIEWGITGVPETFIIDANGIIRFHYVGPMSDFIITHDFAVAWGNAHKFIPE